MWGVYRPLNDLLFLTFIAVIIKNNSYCCYIPLLYFSYCILLIIFEIIFGIIIIVYIEL